MLKRVKLQQQPKVNCLEKVDLAQNFLVFLNNKKTIDWRDLGSGDAKNLISNRDLCRQRGRVKKLFITRLSVCYVEKASTFSKFFSILNALMKLRLEV